MPNEDEAATWVVGRDGGAAAAADRRGAALRAARQRQLGRGAPAHSRRRPRRHRRHRHRRAHAHATSRARPAARASPRWARGGTHVTFVRDNNLFIVPRRWRRRPARSCSSPTWRRAAPTRGRPTASACCGTKRSSCSTGWSRKPRGASGARRAISARALPKFELGERQTVVDAALSGDETYAFLVVADRAQARTAQVPRYVSESAYTEEIPARNKVGDAQERRRLAILNLKTGEGVWAGLDGISEPVAIPKPPDGDDAPLAPAPPPATRRPREARRALGRAAAVARRPARRRVGARGRQHRPLAGAGRSGDRQARRSSTPRTTRRGCARSAPSNNVSGGLGWLPGQPPRVVPRRARRLDAPLHRRRRPPTRPQRQAADDRPLRDRHRRALA